MLGYYLTLIEEEEDRSKFERLYHAQRHNMLYVAQQVLSDRALAEDVVQEAFLRLTRCLHKIDDPTSHKTKAFVVIITKRLAINVYNKRKQRNEAEWDDSAKAIHSVLPSQLDEASPLMRAIASLPELYAHTMILRYVHALTDTECAKALGISPAALRKRLERGRKLLRERLDTLEAEHHV